MSIRARMIILPLSVVLHYCLTKTSDLKFIRCHNVQLYSCWMVVMTSLRALSGHEDAHKHVRLHAMTVHVQTLSQPSNKIKVGRYDIR